jgi:hypothetical protein
MKRILIYGEKHIEYSGLCSIFMLFPPLQGEASKLLVETLSDIGNEEKLLKKYKPSSLVVEGSEKKGMEYDALREELLTKSAKSQGINVSFMGVDSYFVDYELKDCYRRILKKPFFEEFTRKWIHEESERFLINLYEQQMAQSVLTEYLFSKGDTLVICGETHTSEDSLFINLIKKKVKDVFLINQ